VTRAVFPGSDDAAHFDHALIGAQPQLEPVFWNRYWLDDHAATGSTARYRQATARARASADTRVDVRAAAAASAAATATAARFATAAGFGDGLTAGFGVATTRLAPRCRSVVDAGEFFTTRQRYPERCDQQGD
jgi:hypothetical protein